MVFQYFFFLNYVLHKTEKTPKKHYEKNPNKPLFYFKQQREDGKEMVRRMYCSRPLYINIKTQVHSNFPLITVISL